MEHLSGRKTLFSLLFGHLTTVETVDRNTCPLSDQARMKKSFWAIRPIYRQRDIRCESTFIHNYQMLQINNSRGHEEPERVMRD